MAQITHYCSENYRKDMQMKINKVHFTMIIAFMTVLFIVGLIISTRFVHKNEPVQTQKNQDKQQINATLKLTVSNKQIRVGDTLKIVVSVDTAQNISASDIVLAYDPTFLEFDQEKLISKTYSIVRVLSENGTLIISLLENENLSGKTPRNNDIVTIPFTLLKKGNTTIKPVLSDVGTTSTLLFGNDTKNQLSHVLPLE